MINRGGVTASLNVGGTYRIQAGYHNGNGVVTASGLSEETEGTATEDDILMGETAWVNGSKLTGSMTNNGAKTSTINAGQSYIIPKGYHNGSGKVTANGLAEQTSATAVAGDILSGKTAYVNGVKVNGSMPARYQGIDANSAAMWEGNLYYRIPYGYYPNTYTPTECELKLPLDKVRAAIGYTNPATVLSGTTIAGMAGTIPRLNAYAVQPQSYTQTINTSGHYINGNFTINPVPSNFVDVNVNQDLFRNGSYGKIAVGAAELWQDAPGSMDAGVYFRNIVNGKIGLQILTRYTSQDFASTYAQCNMFWFKKKILLTKYKTLELYMSSNLSGTKNCRCTPRIYLINTIPNKSSKGTYINFYESCQVIDGADSTWKTTNYITLGNVSTNTGIKVYNGKVRFNVSNYTGWWYIGFSMYFNTGTSAVQVPNGSYFFIDYATLYI